MVGKLNLYNQVSTRNTNISFKKWEHPKKEAIPDRDTLLIDEKHPKIEDIKIRCEKFRNAFTKYPAKGFKGSKNANFYEFLTMGVVPYLVGSAGLMAVFNLASAFFDTGSAVSACKLGKKMAIGVATYGTFKTLSKKLIEIPVKLKHGIDMNMPYKKLVHGLPEEGLNPRNLKTQEYHKVYESVDFPRWDLLYDNPNLGEGRNAYYDKIADKMNVKTPDLLHSDQKVKPLIRKKVVQTRLYTTLSSYLWAAVGVGISMQKPFENMMFTGPEVGKGLDAIKFVTKHFTRCFVKSCKEFVSHPQKADRIAGRALLGAAIGTTLLGNLVTLSGFNKDKSKSDKQKSLINPQKEKVVC